MLDVISSTNASTNAVISGSDYSVNAIGQRTGISRSGSATPASASAAYGYNIRGELISADEATNAQDRAYQFDGIGNRQKTVSGSLTLPGSNNHSINALNQYTTIPNLPATPSYDDDGNAKAYPLPVNTAANAALTYDGENRLIKVVTGSTTVEYIYDAFSRRVAKTVGSTRTYYVYDGWNCIAEYTGAVHTTGAAPTPTPTYTHTWGTDLSGSLQGAGGVGGLLQTTAHGALPTHHYPIYDGNGNITAYIDNACAVQASFDYDPFGNITNNNNPQNLPYAFSTKPREPETGLYYYGYRFYTPSTGRWINRDPIEEDGGMNLYGFVGNSCINMVDVFGEFGLFSGLATMDGWESEYWASGTFLIKARYCCPKNVVPEGFTDRGAIKTDVLALESDGGLDLPIKDGKQYLITGYANGEGIGKATVYYRIAYTFMYHEIELSKSILDSNSAKSLAKFLAKSIAKAKAAEDAFRVGTLNVPETCTLLEKKVNTGGALGFVLTKENYTIPAIKHTTLRIPFP